MSEIAFIWDFDGTLVDSYQASLDVLELIHANHGLAFDRSAVLAYVLKESIGSHLRHLVETHDLVFEELLAFFNQGQEERDHMISLMPHAEEALRFTKDKGIRNFIYTHKGASTQAVLETLGIADYFQEVITSANGFVRKPHPEGVDYLLDKYGLDKASTYYIGDRSLDMKVAENAGIWSINLTQADSAYNRKIETLADLPPLFGD